MRVLVTGGAGFIGSAFVRLLLAETDHEVRTIDALAYAGSRANLAGVMDHRRHEFVEADIREPAAVRESVAWADALVNFAAHTHVDRSIDDTEPFVSTNVEGTRCLLELARETDLDRFLQVSTDEVYGEVLEGTASETDRLEPRNPYAATKASADLLVRSFHVTYDLPTLVTRSANNYGPRQHTEKFIPKMILRADRGESLPLYGDGTNVRDWTYVRDNCRAILTVLTRGTPGEVYNVGSGTERRNIDVASRILELVGGDESLIEFVEDRPGHDRRYALDTSKVEALGWEPHYDFEAGLRETVRHYLDGEVPVARE
jgi:dTDP-glucose 4,6-dehydratase